MNISHSIAADLLVSAFEGGSNYWYIITGHTKPAVEVKPWGADEYTPKYISYPFSEGGAILISDMEDDESDTHTLNMEAIEHGANILSTDPHYSHHYADVVSENIDANTGDVFLQLCLFGEVIYG